MAKLVECPFCKTMVGERRLTRHVIEQHMAISYLNGRDGRPQAKWWFCWCGMEQPSISTMQEHVNYFGGVHAHYLACQLDARVQ